LSYMRAEDWKTILSERERDVVRTKVGWSGCKVGRAC
jgi:hypothetical protein